MDEFSLGGTFSHCMFLVVYRAAVSHGGVNSLFLLTWRRQHFGMVLPGYLPEPLDVRWTFGGRW